MVSFKQLNSFRFITFHFKLVLSNYLENESQCKRARPKINFRVNTRTTCAWSQPLAQNAQPLPQKTSDRESVVVVVGGGTVVMRFHHFTTDWPKLGRASIHLAHLAVASERARD